MKSTFTDLPHPTDKIQAQKIGGANKKWNGRVKVEGGEMTVVTVTVTTMMAAKVAMVTAVTA
jgi:hypothetical protein